MATAKPKTLKVNVTAKSHHAYIDGELKNLEVGEQELPAELAKHMIELGKAEEVTKK